jgi:acetoin utilization deacetylase AcuC-like enzyme
VGFVYSDVYLKHRNPMGHPESAERLTSIVAALKASDYWGRLVHIAPRMATREELLAVHTERHVDRMEGYVGYADPDTYVSEGSHEAALYAAGGVIEAVDRAKAGEIDRAFCAVRPPGHHAEADRAMGFCIFNNIAVAARHAQKIGYRRIFIVDFDVHHGNGTQHTFESDPDVYYMSTHQAHHYPGTGAHTERGTGAGLGATANYPMSGGAGDREYHMIYADVLPQLMRHFGPDMVLVSAGYDVLMQDPLAGIRITEEGIRFIVEATLCIPGVPVVYTLEGGYDLGALGESVTQTVGILLEYGQ